MRHQKAITLYIVITLLILFYIAFNFYIQSAKKNDIVFLENMLKKEAITVFETIGAIRQWVANHNGVHIANEHIAGDTESTHTHAHPLFTKLSPDIVTSEIASISKISSHHTYSLVSNNPINPKHRPNKFERRALDYFEQNKAEQYFYERKEDFSEFNFVGALVANKTCLNCHTKSKEGEVLGGINIEVPLQDYQQKYNLLMKDYQNIFLFGLLIAVLSVLLISYLIYQFLVKKNLLEQNNYDLLQLKKSNETLIKRYKYAVEGSQNGIWDWDLQTNELYFDKNWKSMLGYEEEELENHLHTWDILVHPDDKENAYHDIMANQQRLTDFYINIHRLKHKDGHWVWILDRGRTYFNQEGKAVRMVGFHTDITELKELEQKLYEKEQNLMTAQEIARMGHWRYDTINDRFVVSEALYKLLGIPRDKIFHAYSDFIEYIHEDDVDYYLHEHQKVFYEKTQSSLQYRMYKYNSDEIIYIHEHISCMYNNQADVENFIGTIQDISAIKIAEKELELFKKIIDNSPISIIITDANAKIIYVNKYFSKISHYSSKEVIGKNPSIIKSDNTTKEEYEQMWATLLEKKMWGGIFKNLTKDNKEFWETALIIPILDDKDEIVNYLGIKREITKEVFLEKELREKEEMMLAQSKHAAMGEMISMIAHQWRQPITTVSMIANNMLAEIELEIFDTENAKEYALQLNDQTQYLSKTIDDFRNFFKENKNTEEMSLEELFKELNTIISASLTNNNIELQLEYDQTLRVKTYVRELLQVLVNIIKNAKEAYEHSNSDSKVIHVGVKQNNNKLYMYISDTAGGIKIENLNKIFEPYFTTKEEHNGTGLGLYMSKMIMQKHLKGDIKVKNIHNGSEFCLILEQFIQ